MQQDFVSLLEESLSHDDCVALLESLDTKSPVSLRLNPRRGLASFINEEETGVEVSGVLEVSGVEVARRVPWCDTGVYLNERPSFTLDPVFHAGGYYVQEASSMYIYTLKERLASMAATLGRGLRVLDLCAAPGGKSTLLADILPSHSASSASLFADSLPTTSLFADSLLVCNEVIHSRVGILAENISKWGCSNVIVTCNDVDDFGFLSGFFDVVLVDAPCSGEGMFRKDLRARDLWSLDNVKLCAERQRRILSGILPCVAPDGLLIYSTCTFNHYEDEDQVEWLTSEYGLSLLDSRKFMPHKDMGEGFFVAVFVNDGSCSDSDLGSGSGLGSLKGSGSGAFRVPRQKVTLLEKGLSQVASNWLNGNFAFLSHKDLVRAIPQELLDIYALLNKRLNVVYGGVDVACVKGRELIPCHELAQAIDLREGAFESVELDYTEAIKYLRREAIVLPPTCSKGYIIVRYKGLALGFVKNIGNRANNLYPQSRRILKSV